MKIEHVYLKEQPGVVRLTSKIEGLLTAERCIKEAEELLRERENLKDGISVDFGDSMLLAHETNINSVVFVIEGKEVEVNSENMEEIKNRYLQKKQPCKKISREEQHMQAIEEAVAEIWGDITKKIVR